MTRFILFIATPSRLGEAVSSIVQKPTQRVKRNEETEGHVPNEKNNIQSQNANLNEIEIRNLPDKKLKVIVIKTLTKLERGVVNTGRALTQKCQI